MPSAIPMDAATLRTYSTWFMIYGAVLSVLGLLAIALPGIATLATSLLAGWLLLAAGVFGVMAVFRAGRAAAGFWWHLFTAMVYVLAGLALLFSPVAGVITLTILLTAYLLAGGISKLMIAASYRQEIPRAWAWVLMSGLVDLVLAGLIMMGFPGTALWVIGLMVGINLLMMGISLMIAAWNCREVAAESLPPPAQL